jgi:thiosulfate dehydrogenase [quinone] large subunit
MPDPDAELKRHGADPDLELAVSLARFGLGVNIALHGWTRVPGFPQFAAHLDQQFAHSILPPFLVRASAYGIVGAECALGLLLLVGFALRATLAAGAGLMIVLLLGTCLIQDWSAAGDQLIYLGFYAFLLALRRRDAWSLDARLARAQAEHAGAPSIDPVQSRYLSATD